MGAWILRFQFVLLGYATMLHFSFFENLQVQATTIASPSHDSQSELRDECRFGTFREHNSTCDCTNWNCGGFTQFFCMEKDNGNNRSFPSDCAMLAHACKHRKKMLVFWQGTCNNITGVRFETGERYRCNGSKECVHGICLRDSSNSSHTFCRCLNGYTGSRCEEREGEDELNTRRRRSSHHRPLNSTGAVNSTEHQGYKKARKKKFLIRLLGYKFKIAYSHFLRGRHRPVRLLE